MAMLNEALLFDSSIVTDGWVLLVTIIAASFFAVVEVLRYKQQCN